MNARLAVWTPVTLEEPPSDPPLDVILAYIDADTGEHLVAQGCRLSDGTYVLTPDDGSRLEPVTPTHWMPFPQHPALMPPTVDVLAIRSVEVHCTDPDDPYEADVYLTVELEDGTRKRTVIGGGPCFLDTEVSAYELRNGATVR